MKKKIIALVLAVGMVGSMATIAFAAQPNGTAGIDFALGWNGPEITDPTDPNLPGGPDFWDEFKHDRNLNFGSHDIHNDPFTYNSVTHGGGSKVGFAVVTTKPNWTLQVSVGPFEHETQTGLYNMQGFRLRMVDGVAKTQSGGGINFTMPTEIPNNFVETNKDGNGKGSAVPVFKGSHGIHGAVATGSLEVPHAKELGKFQAQLTWEIVPN
jgi:hypothetical protein